MGVWEEGIRDDAGPICAGVMESQVGVQWRTASDLWTKQEKLELKFVLKNGEE